MIICHTTYKINKIDSKGCREGPSKVKKFMKTAKFMIIRHTIYKFNEIYSKGCREGPLKVTKIVKITKVTKTAKFAQACCFSLLCICIKSANNLHTRGDKHKSEKRVC